jgi:hypothetical protein
MSIRKVTGLAQKGTSHRHPSQAETLQKEKLDKFFGFNKIRNTVS